MECPVVRSSAQLARLIQAYRAPSPRSCPRVEDDLPPFGLIPIDELCSACFNEHPEPRGVRCPIAAWETARRQLTDLVETMDTGTLPAAQCTVICALADLMAVELE